MTGRLARTVPAVLAIALALAACGGGSPSVQPTGGADTPLPVTEIGACVTRPDESIEPAAPKGVDFKTQLKTPGKLTVGSDIAFPPFESVNPTTNQPEGFDIDLGTEIARRLGLEAEFINTGFDALFTQSLPRGQFDVGISAITIKPERQRSVDFTTPYFQADLSLAVPTDSEVQTIEDLQGTVIGAQQATTGADCANAVKEQVQATEVRTYETAPQAFDDMRSGRVGAVINDLPATQQILAQRPGEFEIVQRINTSEVYGIAISKEKPDLRVAINEALQEMFDDGTYVRIYEKWFKGQPEFDLPPADLG